MFKDKVKKMLKDESGQGATEYILLLVVVVGLVLLFGPQIREQVENVMSGVGGGVGNILDSNL